MPNEELQGLGRLRVIGNYVQRRKLTSHDIRELALDLENHSNSFYQLPSSPKMEKALKATGWFNLTVSLYLDVQEQVPGPAAYPGWDGYSFPHRGGSGALYLIEEFSSGKAVRSELEELDMVTLKIRQETSATYHSLTIASAISPRGSGTPHREQ